MPPTKKTNAQGPGFFERDLINLSLLDIFPHLPPKNWKATKQKIGESQPNRLRVFLTNHRDVGTPTLQLASPAAGDAQLAGRQTFQEARQGSTLLVQHAVQISWTWQLTENDSDESCKAPKKKTEKMRKFLAILLVTIFLGD